MAVVGFEDLETVVAPALDGEDVGGFGGGVDTFMLEGDQVCVDLEGIGGLRSAFCLTAG